MDIQPIKITEQELAELTRIRDMFTEAQYAFGQLYLQRKSLEEGEQAMLSTYKSLQEDEKKLLNAIIDKYGEGNLDPKTGTFTPKSK